MAALLGSHPTTPENDRRRAQVENDQDYSGGAEAGSNDKIRLTHRHEIRPFNEWRRLDRTLRPRSPADHAAIVTKARDR
ncbi:hypothetical protein [Gordonia spumicola]|uniref:hypothetical protein n=1 Tax=Gordonia spumicola TaxID=589161 RepID=UPI00137A5A4A|nr:hypothetical protein [Gordonia spumicola]